MVTEDALIVHACTRTCMRSASMPRNHPFEALRNAAVWAEESADDAVLLVIVMQLPT
jgi:hypothetical protein